MTDIILADSEQQKDILWKKYLSKKKSFAKAQLALAEFNRIDRPGYHRWMATFAQDIMAETFFIRHEAQKYDENIQTFRSLCRITGKSPAAILFQIQKECILQDKFFWGIVRDQYQKASEEADKRFRERIREFLKNEGRGDSNGIYDSFEKTLHGEQKKATSHSQVEQPEIKENSQELKKLYRTLCLRHHPDKTGIYDKNLWLEIQDAYERGSVRKLQELMKRPVAKPDTGNFGLSCEEIRQMIEDLEREFKPVRAELRRAKQSYAWNYCSWDDEKRQAVKEDLSQYLADDSKLAQERLDGYKHDVASIFSASRFHKHVQITIEKIPTTKLSYQIRLTYGPHQKEIPIRRRKKQDDAEFACACVTTALSALKTPCAVLLKMPSELQNALPDFSQGYIYGNDYQNAISRHILSLA